MTVIGNVVKEPDRRRTAAGDVVSFRLASTTRYWSAEEQAWRDGGSVFLTVSCWKRLVAGVGASVMRGSPVIAHGPVRLREYTTADGQRRSDLEMRAVSVGLDLARCIIQRVDNPQRRDADGPGRAGADAAARGADDEGAPPGESFDTALPAALGAEPAQSGDGADGYEGTEDAGERAHAGV